MRKLIGTIIAGVILSLFAANLSTANPRHRVVVRDQVVVKEKVVNYGQLLKIIAVPVTQTDAEYYWEKASKVEISDEDAQKIAEYVIKLLEERLEGEKTVNETETAVAEIVNNKCLSCHNGEKKGGGLSFIGEDGSLSLSHEDGSLTQGEVAFLMFSATFDQTMPKGGEKLTDDEVSVLRKFAVTKTKVK